jgi:hypothetical protein
VPIDGFPEETGDYVFGLDQLEVDVIAEVVSGLVIRADVNYFPSVSAATLEDLVARDDSLVEQGFVRADFANGLFLTAGKQNAPVGAESLDPHLMYQYSHSLIFDFAQPSNLTGLFVGWENEQIGAQVFATNDWDTPATPEDATIGGRFDYALEAGSVGLASTYGPLAADHPPLMVDLDANYTVGDLTAFVNANFGLQDEDTSLGVMLKAYYAIGERFGATARWDWLDREFGTTIDAMSATGAFLFTIAESFGGLIEVRADIPNEGDTTVFSALELTASF